MIEHNELGTIKLIANPRAKKIIVRYRSGIFYLTHPDFASKKDIYAALEKMKGRLLELKKASAEASFIFTENTTFATLSFKVVIQKKELNSVYTTLRDQVLYITFPEQTNLQEESVQVYIKKVIESACRSEAKEIFSQKIKYYADKYGFSFGQIKITKSRSRWGSCSSAKNINLSYFCMMLPEHLVDFIILHELCHTREMNHSKRFWQLLDSVSEGKAKELTNELKHVKLKW